VFDVFLFAVFPYVVGLSAIVISLWRYVTTGFKFSSLSSQFLEGKSLFWGSVPWHMGIMIVLLGHLIAFLFPREILVWNSIPVRLLILEVSALACGLLAFIGMVLLIHRRLTNDRIRAVTSKVDVLVLTLLFIQVGTGVSIALTNRWGSSWFAIALAPYLQSIFTLQPKVNFIAGMPFLVKLHVFNAFLIIGVLPFTRLIHLLVPPLAYIVRPYQLVMWNWDRKKIRMNDRRV
jgi:nitrate reductase gamma subunit